MDAFYRYARHHKSNIQTTPQTTTWKLKLTGATAMVSTLFTVVGQPKRPMSAGNGGFNRGFPCFPSIDSINACRILNIGDYSINNKKNTSYSAKN